MQSTNEQWAAAEQAREDAIRAKWHRVRQKSPLLAPLGPRMPVGDRVWQQAQDNTTGAERGGAAYGMLYREVDWAWRTISFNQIHLPRPDADNAARNVPFGWDQQAFLDTSYGDLAQGWETTANVITVANGIRQLPKLPNGLRGGLQSLAGLEAGGSATLQLAPAISVTGQEAAAIPGFLAGTSAFSSQARGNGPGDQPPEGSKPSGEGSNAPTNAARLEQLE